MKKLILFSVIASSALLASYFYTTNRTADVEITATNTEIPASYYADVTGAKKAAKFVHRLRANHETDKVDLKDIYKARELARNRMEEKGANEIEWEFMGPNNVGGRTRAMWIDPSNSNYMIAGSVSGGLWISNDGGSNWDEHPQNQEFEALAMNSVTQDKNGNIFFGTGEGFYFFGGQGSAGIPGEGIYMSSDNGATFELLPNTSPSDPNNAADGWAEVNSLAAHPTQNIVYAATGNGIRQVSYNTAGDLATAEWTPTVSASGVGYEVAIGANGIVHAVVGTQYYRSDSNGANFELKSGNGIGQFPAAGNRKRIAVSPSNNDYVYAVNVAGDECLRWVIRSTDGGDTWEEIGAGGSDFFAPLSNSVQCQGSYDLAFAIDPVNENRIFLAGISLWSWSLEGSWQELDSYFNSNPANPYYIHADKHEVVFDPNNENKMYVLCDGGIFKSNNAQDIRPTFARSNKKYNVTQFYSVAADLFGRVLGGTQDNGTQFVNFNNNSLLTSTLVNGGDGGYAEISDINANVMFAATPEGNLLRSGSGGQSFNTFLDERIDCQPTNTDGGCSGDDLMDGGAEFVTPFVLWEDLSTFVFTGGINAKFATGSNTGKLWMTNQPLQLNTVPRWYNVGEFQSGIVISCVAFSEDGNTLFAGSSNGRILRVTNLNSIDLENQHDDVSDNIYVDMDNVTEVSVPGFAGQYVTSLFFDVLSTTLYVTFGGYGNDENVAISENALAADENTFKDSFISMQGSGDTALPPMPVYDVIVPKSNPSKIIVGTDMGIWAADKLGDTFTWTPQNAGLGNVPVFRVREESVSQSIDFLTPDCKILYIGTHGKGLYRSRTYTQFTCETPELDDFGNALGIEEEANQTIAISAYPNPMNQTGTLKITSKKAVVAKMSIYNMEGKLMTSQDLGKLENGTNTISLDVSQFAAGNYIAIVATENGRISTKIAVQ
ncbi:MAG: T9SS type A sorting domain-containing protein [Chitinophagales bacterium]